MIKNIVLIITGIMLGLSLDLTCETIDIQKSTIVTQSETIDSLIKQLDECLSLQTSKSVTLTAYTPTKRECDDDPLIAASMKPVRHGTVAVSKDLYNNGWRFGKKVYIEEHGVFTINDRMNSRHNNCIDVFMWDQKKAKEFGVKTEIMALLLEE
jgi:3D (Asp-Asp-Asp) domain-containing protein